MLRNLSLKETQLIYLDLLLLNVTLPFCDRLVFLGNTVGSNSNVLLSPGVMRLVCNIVVI